jgi:hypothetical protein
MCSNSDKTMVYVLNQAYDALQAFHDWHCANANQDEQYTDSEIRIQNVDARLAIGYMLNRIRQTKLPSPTVEEMAAWLDSEEGKAAIKASLVKSRESKTLLDRARNLLRW